ADASQEDAGTTTSITDRLASALGAPIPFGIKKTMHVHDEIPQMSIIDGLLRLRFPGGIRRGVVGVYADNVEFIEVSELDFVQVCELAAEHKMEQLSGSILTRHGFRASIDQALRTKQSRKFGEPIANETEQDR